MEEFIKYRLTKKKSIEITIELWKWLEENPDKDKRDWPLWRKYDYLENGCACCEYAKRKTKNQVTVMQCDEFCPLFELWPYERVKGERMPCENKKSSYAKWVRACDHIEKSFWARELWMGAQKILEGK